MPRDPSLIDGIRDSLKKARDLELTIADSEKRLSEAKISHFTLTHTTLPDQFNSAGIKNLTLEGEGNLPTYECQLKPYYHAVIPAKWSPEKRAEALAELERHDSGDLAKRVVSVPFPRSEEKECKDLCKKLDKLGFSYSVSFDLPWNTLTAWLREMVEKGEMPNLELIGGQVGQIVKLKSQEDDL